MFDAIAFALSAISSAEAQSYFIDFGFLPFLKSSTFPETSVEHIFQHHTNDRNVAARPDRKLNCGM
jgi:hypothetical protein